MRSGGSRLENEQPRRVRLGVYIIGGAFLFFGLLFIAWNQWFPSLKTITTMNETLTKERQSLTELPSVKVMKPERQDVERTMTLPANVSPMYRATLYGKVSGYVKWMGFDKGDKVKKGEVLAIIEAPEIEEEFKKADVDYQIKKLTFERLNAVWKENPNFIAQQDVDSARAATQAAKHLRDSREALLQYTKVRAPFSGVITARYVDPGVLVQAATESGSQANPLYTIMDLDAVRVYVSVPQEEAWQVKPGLPVTLRSTEIARKEWEATITRTTKALDPSTRTLLVEIDVPNKDGGLQPGSLLKATLKLGQKKKVLMIPSQSVIAHGEKAPIKVFIVEKGKVQQVTIEVGSRVGDWIEILSGLSGDEDVVVEGKAPLTEGQQVRTVLFNKSFKNTEKNY